MAVTAKGTKWELKQSVFFILAFIPVLNCIVFFHMASRVENKKWTLLGWMTLILGILFLVGAVLTINLAMSETTSKYYTIDYSSMPKEEDYIGYNYYEKYPDGTYKSLPEYKQYEEDYNAWHDAYYYSEEYIAAENLASSRRDMFSGICVACFSGLLIESFIMLIVAYTERVKYLRRLAQTDNTIAAAKRIQEMRSAQDTLYHNAAPTDAVSSSYGQNTQKTVQGVPQSLAPLDINTATEEQIAALPGLTVIDAKKALSYREKNGEFQSADEFFEVIQAKPHVMVRLQNRVHVTPIHQSNASESKGRRRIDL